MKTNGTHRSSHASHSFEQVEVWEADHMTLGCTKTERIFLLFYLLGKLNEIWIYLTLIENNWHVVPIRSLIERKNNQLNIFEWYPHIVVISGSKWNGALRGWNQSRLFPTCHWLFPTCHISSWVPQMPLTALFHLLPPTSHRGTPTVRAKWKNTSNSPYP